MPKPVVDPEIPMRSQTRDPVIRMVGFALTSGTTALDGSDDVDHPVPVKARMLKVDIVRSSDQIRRTTRPLLR